MVIFVLRLSSGNSAKKRLNTSYYVFHTVFSKSPISAKHMFGVDVFQPEQPTWLKTKTYRPHRFTCSYPTCIPRL